MINSENKKPIEFALWLTFNRKLVDKEEMLYKRRFIDDGKLYTIEECFEQFNMTNDKYDLLNDLHKSE